MDQGEKYFPGEIGPSKVMIDICQNRPGGDSAKHGRRNNSTFACIIKIAGIIIIDGGGTVHRIAPGDMCLVVFQGRSDIL